MSDPERLGDLRPKARESFLNLARDLAEFHRASSDRPAGDVVAALVEHLGYIDYLGARGDSPDAQVMSRVENVEELVAAAREFSERAESPTLVSFLEEVSLTADIDDWNQRPEAVNLMTLHNAKGLEFRWVFITGLEEGLLPHASSMRSRDPLELEEERRLLYVGLTRAREKVQLLAADQRFRYQGRAGVQVSRFVGEIPEPLMEVASSDVDPLDQRPEWDGEGRGASHEDSVPEDSVPEDGVDEDGVDEVVLSPGMSIRHPEFGSGRIQFVEGAGRDLKITVQFESGLRKRIMVRYANLELV